MFQLVMVQVIQAERERELEAAIRVRQLLRPRDGAIDPAPAVASAIKRPLTVRVRPTEG